ncbi:MAG: hypothetical protein M3Q72_06345 [Actinomycetota bacterium]|nr:hypothetical protein [Actinomycetota bacterium]
MQSTPAPPTAAPPPPPPPPSAPYQVLLARETGAALGRLAGQGRTANRLRGLQAATVVAAILFALLGSLGLARRDAAIDDVRQASSQLIAVQNIRVSLVQADSIATSSYLAGGQEDPAKRTEYLAAIGRATDQLVDVSNGVDSADAARLAEASELLGGYVGLVEQARANNRQGFPVGAAYQRQANAVVTNDSPEQADIVTLLREVEQSQRATINERLDDAHRAGAWFDVAGWTLLGMLLVGLLWLARRFKRLVNIPIAVAGVLLAIVVLAGTSRQGSSMSDADEAVGTLQTADLATQSRAAGFDARSQEALALINRGNGQANEARWLIAQATAAQSLDRCRVCEPSAIAFGRYSDAHERLRDADDSGDWEGAVAMTLGNQGGLVDDFDAFADATESVSDDNAARADERLSDARSGLGMLRILTIAAGLIVAVLVAIGYGQRLREYR